MGVRRRSSHALHLRQHADEHRSERPILLAVDKELGERLVLRFP